MTEIIEAGYDASQRAPLPVARTRFDTLRHQASLALLAGIDLPREALVLDVGCGEGAVMMGIQEITPLATVIGMDLAVGSFHIGRRVRLNLIRGTAEELPFKTDHMDLVLALEVVEHLRHPEKLLEESHRVLRPGGHFLLSTPNRNSITGLSGRFLFPLAGRTWNAWDGTHQKVFSPGEVATMLTSLKFEVLKQAGFWFIPDIPYLKALVGRLGPRKRLVSPDETPLGVTWGFISMFLARKNRLNRELHGSRA